MNEQSFHELRNDPKYDDAYKPNDPKRRCVCAAAFESRARGYVETFAPAGNVVRLNQAKLAVQRFFVEAQHRLPPEHHLAEKLDLDHECMTAVYVAIVGELDELLLHASPAIVVEPPTPPELPPAPKRTRLQALILGDSAPE